MRLIVAILVFLVVILTGLEIKLTLQNLYFQNLVWEADRALDVCFEELGISNQEFQNYIDQQEQEEYRKSLLEDEEEQELYYVPPIEEVYIEPEPVCVDWVFETCIKWE